MQTLNQSVVVKMELSQKARFFVCYGQELCLVTERTRLWIQAVEVIFLYRVVGLLEMNSINQSGQLKWCRMSHWVVLGMSNKEEAQRQTQVS